MRPLLINNKIKIVLKVYPIVGNIKCLFDFLLNTYIYINDIS